MNDLLMTGSDGAGEMKELIAQGVARYMAESRFGGLSVGVFRSGMVHSFHSGATGKHPSDTPDNRTIYPIASLTKTFTGMLAAQAELEHKLKVSDDIRLYLADNYENLAFEHQPIRICHLLSHRSGLPFVLPEPPAAEPNFVDDALPVHQLKEAVAQARRENFFGALRHVELMSAPGTRFLYSNAAAQLAGYILEEVFDLSFETLVQQRIAGPLGMQDTMIVPSAHQEPRLIDGYDEAGTKRGPGPDQFQAAGALKSTLADLMAYARWQLDEHDPVVRLSHQPTYQNDEYAVGLNWQILSNGVRRVIWQDGAIPGYASLMIVHPERSIALVLLTNALDGETLQRLRTLANGITTALDTNCLCVP